MIESCKMSLLSVQNSKNASLVAWKDGIIGMIWSKYELDVGRKDEKCPTV